MIYYGKYVDYPPSLRMLMEVEEELKDSLYSLDTILLLEEKPFVYPITPYDVITFASAGVDGIHFGFLTDFGQVDNLEEAYIVCVSPMNFDHPIKIVARNIKEFLRLLITMGYESSLIENINNYSSEKEYLQLFAEIKKSRISPEYEEQVQLICDKLSDKFGISKFENLYEYVEVVLKREREKVMCIKTLDGLGIINANATENNHSSLG
ncbi:hypothetical protein [Bacillus alkalicellulosilyticus]|uniref:hypothetical protein n=1 Tax=Alkalihalobacterium alkalicellulosilyticum TaxID=1912214 RepID=UPI0009975337|nr:hypothetical protein [Bacillus alkalicellulosilyticus]